jgi:hypothetical protein
MAPKGVRQIATVAKNELLKYLLGWRLLAIVLLTITQRHPPTRNRIFL